MATEVKGVTVVFCLNIGIIFVACVGSVHLLGSRCGMWFFFASKFAETQFYSAPGVILRVPGATRRRSFITAKKKKKELGPKNQT